MREFIHKHLFSLPINDLYNILFINTDFETQFLEQLGRNDISIKPWKISDDVHTQTSTHTVNSAKISFLSHILKEKNRKVVVKRFQSARRGEIGELYVECQTYFDELPAIMSTKYTFENIKDHLDASSPIAESITSDNINPSTICTIIVRNEYNGILLKESLEELMEKESVKEMKKWASMAANLDRIHYTKSLLASITTDPNAGIESISLSQIESNNDTSNTTSEFEDPQMSLINSDIINISKSLNNVRQIMESNSLRLSKSEDDLTNQTLILKNETIFHNKPKGYPDYKTQTDAQYKDIKPVIIDKKNDPIVEPQIIIHSQFKFKVLKYTFIVIIWPIISNWIWSSYGKSLLKKLIRFIFNAKYQNRIKSLDFIN